MTLLIIVLAIVSTTALAADDCIFDESAYIKFIHDYSADNSNAKVEADGKRLRIDRNGEEITVTGGGCTHLGMTIEARIKQAYTEKQFLQKTLDLSIELGSWLINTRALKDSIDMGRYQIIDGIYYIEVDAMTVFDASYDKLGNIRIDFYIN